MDEDRIGLVLVRISELRSKITNCIQKSLANGDKEDAESRLRDSKARPEAEEDGVEEEEEEEEAESLLNIRDALESLESQLSSLQALQEQQLYEKETALAAIRFGQRKLLEKLKEYKGEHLDVIHEAIAFAGETVQDNNDLLLPPYPSRLSGSVVSQFPYARKVSPNGVAATGPKHDSGRGSHDSRSDETIPEIRKPLRRVKMIIGTVAKAAVTVAGVISILSLAGYEPRLKKRDNHFKLFGSSQQPESGENGTGVECPPGKVPVLENGEIRCLVKERVEIPFESVVSTPDVKYGCG